MAKGTVYVMNFSGENLARARGVCQRLHLGLKEVPASSFDLTVGEMINGLPGHARERLFEEEVVLLRGLSPQEVNGTVDALRSGGYRGLVAVETRFNRQWKLARLVTELQEERARLEG